MSREVFKVDGLKDLDRAFIELAEEIGPKKVRTPARKAMHDVLKPMADEAKGRVRVDQGHLQRSIKVGGTLNRSQKKLHEKQSDIEVHMGPSGLTQAITEEFGAVDQAPHPYIRPTWEANKDGALDKLQDFLWGRIEATRKRVAKLKAKAGV